MSGEIRFILICLEVDPSLISSMGRFWRDFGLLTFGLGYLMSLEGKNLTDGLAMTLFAGMQAIKSSKD